MSSCRVDPGGERTARLRLALPLAVLFALVPGFGLATTVIPISDRELYLRADVVVHGVVVSSDVTVDEQGRPETLSIIEPLAVLKGQLAGSLVLHQLGGTLPDGRFLHMWGRPEYLPGREVIVFAVARPAGEYETAEMLLGKFEVARDESGNLFAVPDLAVGVHPGVDVVAREGEGKSFGGRGSGEALGGRGDFAERQTIEQARAPRDLERFLVFLGSGAPVMEVTALPQGELEPLLHPEASEQAPKPKWGNIGDTLYRWNNGASAAWTLSGTVNIDGGGLAEAQGALAAWTDDSNSSINYTQGTGTSNVIYLNATSSSLGCGWSSCLSGSGVIGCGGPSGSGSNSWRGDSYRTITGGTVELRAYCTHNGFSSTITQSTLEHELGHTLGLGHSDKNVSVHDVCRGDEDAAIMRSVVQSSKPLGADDQDAIRWIYGDGGNSCGGAPPPLSVAATASPTNDTLGSPVAFTASISGGTAPYTTTWSPGDGSSLAGNPASHNYAAAGQYTVQVVVVDATGAQVQSGAGQVTVVADTTPPTVSITQIRITGGTVRVNISVSDNVAVVRTNLYVDSVLAATSTSPPFTMTMSAKKLSRGTHTAVVTAYDAAGNAGTSPPQTFVR